MTLNTLEYRTFLRTHLEFLFFVGQKSKIIEPTTEFMEFADMDSMVKFNCRDFFLKNQIVLDEYMTTYFDKLTNEQISILTGFKKQITNTFVLFKCLTNHAIFIDTTDHRIFAVKALGDRFDHLYNRFPVLIETTILPFNNHIIYDGFMKFSSAIVLGPLIKSELNELYKTAKKKIIYK